MTQRMQFGSYLFPHNPARIEVAHTRNEAVHLCPGYGTLRQDLGDVSRVVRVQGSFFGATADAALQQLDALRGVADENPTALLFLPGSGPFPATLRTLHWTAEGDGRILSYQAEFVEVVPYP